MDDTTSWTRLSRLLDEALDVAPEERDVWLAGLEKDQNRNDHPTVMAAAGTSEKAIG